MQMDKLGVLTSFLHNIVVFNIPLLYGTVGEIVVEKSGSLNLGVEGIMAVGAIFVVSALVCMLHFGSTIAAATFPQVDSSFANMLQGAILFLVLAADFYTRFRVVIDHKGGNGNGNG